ncbi:MAG: HAD-IIA family hydrolase [Alicyclobacillaceae bacterium]|nr:HAD-IIA family hydrolase [Alicyclobacillaceae bacterium]
MGYLNRSWELALIDLDGTLYRGDRVIAGAAAFVERLRVRGIQPVFFTNNATRTPAQVVDKLMSMGIRCTPDEVCTSAQAAAAVIRASTGGSVPVAYIGMDGLREAILEAGLEPLEVRAGTPRPALESAKAAAIGLDTRVTYGDLAAFCRVVSRLGQFVLTNGDVRLPVEDGFVPGNGALGAFVETATGVAPVVTGKPEPRFVAYALQRYGARPERTLVIGDNLLTDVAAGVRAGLYTIQVLSGVRYAADGEPQARAVGMSPDEAAACSREPQQPAGQWAPDEVYGSVDELFPDGDA